MSEQELRALIGDIRDSLELQRIEGKERGDKIVGLLEKSADMNARLKSMEYHVRNECVVNNGVIKDIYTKLERLRVSFIWIVAGCAAGGGIATGALEIIGKVLAK